jgi:uncharacterized protein with HEPN domain
VIDDDRRLLDIRDAVERIASHAGGGREAFDRGEMLQVWMLHHLQIIGEAVRTLSGELRDAHPEVPWRKIVGMRHVRVHQYFEIDLDAVWNAVENEVEPLKRHVERILGERNAFDQ